MKILQITPEAPGQHSGGQLVIRQTALSLKGNGYEIDYVGPEIEDQQVRALYSHVYALEPSGNVLLRVYDTLHRNTNQRYRSWLKLDLDFKSYDAIILEFTKLDYVLERIPTDRLLVRVHNVESDYSEKNYRYKKTPSNYIDKTFSGIREKNIVGRARKLLVLTEKDRKRLQELYHVPDENMVTIPVCIEDKGERGEELSETTEGGTVNMILTGSLWFGPNYEGIKWFLDNVYSKLDIPKKLIIAGARPNGELVERVKKEAGVTLVDSPDSMEPYFRQSDLAVTPIFDGAGMKVKVAEALSYGLPVVGTSHAFTGYGIEHKVNSYHSDSPEGFIEGIRHFYSLSSEERQRMKRNSRQLFQQCYSQERSCELFRQVLKGIR